MYAITLSHACSPMTFSLRPLVLAALAAGAGVTGLASPSSPTSVVHSAPTPLFGKPLAEMVLRADAAPAVTLAIRPSSLEARAETPLRLETPQDKTSPRPLLDEVQPVSAQLLPPTTLRSIELGFAGPPFPHLPEEQASMPSAELKAMMADVAATRGDAGLSSAAVVPPLGDVQPPLGRAEESARGVQFDVAALVNGVPAGRVPLRIVDGENISVRLGDLLDALRPVMDGATFETFSTSRSADEYITFNTLRASGIAVGFDGDDRLILGRS